VGTYPIVSTQQQCWQPSLDFLLVRMRRLLVSHCLLSVGFYRLRLKNNDQSDAAGRHYDANFYGGECIFAAPVAVFYQVVMG
jgi:hypothetical protein